MLEFEKRVAAAKRELRERSMDGWQRRSVPFTEVELRAGDNGSYSVVGHAAVFNSLSENLGGFREQIKPGAFASVLAKSPDARALFNHDPNLLLAGSRNGSLAMEEDATGLRYKADVSPAIAGTYYGQAMRALLGEGLVTQSSFAFRVAAGGDSWDEDPETGALIRTIAEFSGLFDVSPVTYPAYPAADSSLAGLRVDSGDVGTLAQMLVLAAEFIDDAEEETDAADITAMEAVITTLTGLLSSEESEAASSALTGERTGDGPSAGERDGDGNGQDVQADDAPWRLKAVKRRMALRDNA